MNTDSIIITAIGSIASFLAAQKWIFPMVVKCWEWLTNKKKEFDEQNVNASEELLDYKKSTVELQEKHFQVLLNQITALEEELMKYSDELKTLRTTILRLNARLYDKSLIIAELQKKSCCVENCPHRELCKNKLTEIDELNEDN